jgi:hypothetical protein
VRKGLQPRKDGGGRSIEILNPWRSDIIVLDEAGYLFLVACHLPSNKEELYDKY